jgi:hypothetical protein
MARLVGRSHRMNLSWLLVALAVAVALILAYVIIAADVASQMLARA